jgi:hypothetical protein
MSRPAIAVAVVAAALLGAYAATAEAKDYCCWRVDVSVAGNVHVDAQGEGKNSVSGTFDRTWNWQARELMLYFQRSIRHRGLAQLLTRDSSTIRGKRRWRASERSDQSYVDTSDPPQQIAYPPCRYAKSFPWRSDVQQFTFLESYSRGLFGERGYFLTVRSIYGGGDYEGPCDNSVPNHSAEEEYTSERLSEPANAPLTRWSIFTVDGGGIHPPRLRKTKDFSITLERTKTETLNEDDPRFKQTYAASIRRVARFTWFPRDRLQQERNRLDALTD